MPKTSRSVAWAQKLLDDSVYQQNFLARWRNGSLHPTLEKFVWEHAKGKPVEQLEVHSSTDVTNLSDEDLARLWQHVGDALHVERMNDDVPPSSGPVAKDADPLVH